MMLVGGDVVGRPMRAGFIPLCWAKLRAEC